MGERTQQIEKDPVCGMDVVGRSGEEGGLCYEYAGRRYFFCSPACFQSFRMNPQRFIKKEEGSIVERCELCSKAIRAGEEGSEISFEGKKYTFCCRTCSDVFLRGLGSGEHEGLSSFKKRRPDADDLGDILEWLKIAVESKACDLFLTDGEPPTIKVYGRFQQIQEAPITSRQMREVIQAILPDQKRRAFEEGNEVDLGMDIEGLARFRVNIFRQQNGMSMAVRPIPHEIPSLRSLNLADIFQDLVSLEQGLVLITGPTGSGKTTTLAAFINAINQQKERHIITIEDPIEYVIPNRRSLIHQREVGTHTQSFADGLRSALRENPDIIVVGELRDLESISLAIRAAETGHLVIGTLHSGTAVQTITRVLDVFDSARQAQIRVQLAQSLQVICSQRLFKRKDGQGMVLATEVMMATLALRNIIRQNRVQEIRGYMETGMRERMHTLRQSIQRLVEEDMVDKEVLKEAGGMF